MKYSINIDVFWLQTNDLVKKYYGWDPVHINEMHKVFKILGLEYDRTYREGKKYFFEFRVKNKKKFLLSKIKYGM